MPNIINLNVEAALLVEKIEGLLNDLNLEKKRALSIEDDIVECKEKLRSLKETIRLKELASDFRSLIDENREQDIIRLKEKMSIILLANK